MTKSRISLPVIPYSTNLFQDVRELDNFLLACQEELSVTQSTRILSLSQKIPPVDPLAILQALDAPDRLHFYWENPSQQEAIAACGTTKSLSIESSDRFVQSQKFIQSCLKQTIRIGDIQLPGAGPHFLCSFTFFPTPLKTNSPFPAATIFLPRLQIVKKNNCCILVVNLAFDKKENLKLIGRTIRHTIKTIDWQKYYLITEKNNGSANINQKSERETSKQFKSTVASVLKSIADREFSKIVIADVLDVISPLPFQLIESLHNLRQSHPDCYIFSTSNGQGNNFIGASPERLISIQNQQLVTDALAGSAPRGKTISEDVSFANKLLDSEKERREHQAVSEFIIQRLCQLGLKPRRSPLQLLQLSNIQHLWTPIYAPLPDRVRALDIVAQLHPTPAVAGVPSKIACEQIRRYETFDRSLYAAPLGWVDYQGNSKFIVGIRSASIKGDRARLYAGAGIVAGSDPDKEFAEVQLKLQSLLRALV